MNILILNIKLVAITMYVIKHNLKQDVLSTDYQVNKVLNQCFKSFISSYFWVMSLSGTVV